MTDIILIVNISADYISLLFLKGVHIAEFIQIIVVLC